MRMRSLALMCAALMLVFTGCSPTTRASGDNHDGGTTTGSAMCALYVSVDGKDWYAWRLDENLKRGTEGPEVRATMPNCHDLRIQGETTSSGPGTPVTLVAIKGYSPDDVLFLPDHDLDAYVFTPDPPYEPLHTLPADVQKLIRSGGDARQRRQQRHCPLKRTSHSPTPSGSGQSPPCPAR